MFRRANICPLQRALRDCVGGECVRKKRAAVEALRAVRPLPPLLAPGTRASGHGRRCAVRLAVCGQAEQGVWLAQAAARLGLVRPLFSSLPATYYGLAPSCHILTGLTGRFHSRHASSLSLVSLPRSSRAGSRPLTPCNVLAAAERRSALNLCKMHHIRPRPRCIPRFHLPLKRYPWRLVVSEGHLDHRWGTLGPAGHLRVELPKRFGSGSWASARGTAQARWRIARTGGWAAGAGLR